MNYVGWLLGLYVVKVCMTIESRRLAEEMLRPSIKTACWALPPVVNVSSPRTTWVACEVARLSRILESLSSTLTVFYINSIKAA